MSSLTLVCQETKHLIFNAQNCAMLGCSYTSIALIRALLALWLTVINDISSPTSLPEMLKSVRSTASGALTFSQGTRMQLRYIRVKFGRFFCWAWKNVKMGHSECYSKLQSMLQIYSNQDSCLIFLQPKSSLYLIYFKFNKKTFQTWPLYI